MVTIVRTCDQMSVLDSSSSESVITWLRDGDVIFVEANGTSETSEDRESAESLPEELNPPPVACDGNISTRIVTGRVARL